MLLARAAVRNGGDLWPATLSSTASTLTLLHGEQYYEILYSYTNEPDTPRQSRIAHSNIYPHPHEGDHILIEAVLNVITEIKKKG